MRLNNITLANKMNEAERTLDSSVANTGRSQLELIAGAPSQLTKLHESQSEQLDQQRALAGQPQAKDKQSEVDMLSLQSLVSQRQKANQMASNVSRSMGDAADAIIGNLGGGGGGKPGLKGQEASLNPQPLPPRSWGDEVALNPQPLPPRWVSAITRPGDEAMLNPQPLPPRWIALFQRLFEHVALNPQPLPPVASSRKSHDAVALNPQPLPPRDDVSKLQDQLMKVNAFNTVKG